MTRELQVIAPRGVARSFDPVALVDDWRADMAERVRAGELAATTATTYAQGMLAFLRWHEDNAPSPRVGPGAVRGWKAAQLEQGAKPATVNVRLAGVKAFFRWATAERGLAYDPAAGVPGVTARARRRHRREALGDTEVLRVLAQPDADDWRGRRDRALLHLMAYTGARTVELQRAQLGDLHTSEGVTLDVTGKGRLEADERLHIIHPDAVAALYDWLAIHPRASDPGAPLFCSLSNRNHGGALALGTLRRIVKGYYRAAGVVDRRKTTHSLRHSFVSNLIRQGVPPVKIQAATRHRSLDTLLIYAHELERDADPAEGHVNYAGGTK